MARLVKRGKVYYSDLRIGGKRVQRALSTDKRMAEEKLADLIKERGAQKHNHAYIGDNSYQAAKTRFLNVYSSKSKVTKRHHMRTLARLESEVGPKSLGQITTELLTRLYLGWKENRTDGKAGGLYVRNRDIENITAFMRRAEGWGMVRVQDWDTVMRLDEEPRGRVLFYTPEELKKLSLNLNGPWLTMMMLGSRAGLRPGELFWLEWKDVELGARKIHVEAKPQYAHHVKNYERRTIPMPKDLWTYLLQVKKKATSPLVVAWDDGGRPKTSDVVSTYFSKRVRKAGLPGSLYTLRHTYGSHLAQKGVPLQVIRDLMGHRSVQTTEIYAHLIPEMHQAAVDLLPPF